ncbi:MAG: ribonuclease HII [Deinococcus sp.]|mgnify:CR=1 FL=1|nr:ribonuclease HII [Deinococcus sp.]
MKRPIEADWWEAGLLVAGVDETGRGALAGPVVAAAVILEPGEYPFRDSKTLTAREREGLEASILQAAIAYALGTAEADEVDNLGILKATHLAARRALVELDPRPSALLTDYLKLQTSLPLRAPAKADRDSPTVAAASILAKLARDRHMVLLDQAHPGYGFARHKGYGTPGHLEALGRLGPSPEHRRTFAPVLQPRLI